MAHRLDLIDKKILAILQSEGRITNVELAKRVGISAPPCLRRVRNLEIAGYIEGYHAEIAAKRFGFEITVFVMVGLASQAKTDLVNFEKKVLNWELVRECHMLNGEIDFILKCVATDLPTFQEFLETQLLATENVASVKTSLAIHCSKMAHGIPIS
ncbi:MAG: Lrp/AsnC family transcriptional regulator [Alphaproteobacteria bacterium]